MTDGNGIWNDKKTLIRLIAWDVQHVDCII